MKQGKFCLARLSENLLLRHNTRANAHVLYLRLCVAAKSEITISKIFRIYFYHPCENPVTNDIDISRSQFPSSDTIR